MESSTTVIGLLGGLAIGAAVVWFLLRGAAVRLRADLQAAQAAERTSADEVAVMRRESETWRCKFESEQLERRKLGGWPGSMPSCNRFAVAPRLSPSRNPPCRSRPVGFRD